MNGIDSDRCLAADTGMSLQMTAIAWSAQHSAWASSCPIAETRLRLHHLSPAFACLHG
jgi:hypothetical protein